LGLKRVDLNLNMDREGIFREHRGFIKRRDKLYLRLSKLVLRCWLKERERLQ